MAKRRGSTATLAPPSVLDVAVAYGRVSIGAKTVSVPITIQREEIGLSKADQILCGHRLTGRIEARPKGEQSDQGTFDGFDPVSLTGAFDVKSFNVHKDYLSASLSFSKEDVSLDQLGEFAAKAGRLIVQGVEALENGDGEEEGDPDAAFDDPKSGDDE